MQLSPMLSRRLPAYYSGVGTAFAETALSPRGANAKAAVVCRDRWELGALYSSFTRKEKYGRHNDIEE